MVDYGDCLLDSGNHHKTPGTIEREAAKILKSGAFLLTLGGDHFVTWPLLKAHAAIHGPLALVQFDAHQDTWPDDGKRIDHGSFVARAVKEGIIDPDRSIQHRTAQACPTALVVSGSAKCSTSPTCLAACTRSKLMPLQ